MRKSVYIAALFGLAYLLVQTPELFEQAPDSAPQASSTEQVSEAYAQQQSKVQVRGQGVVIKLLPDDTKGSRHQKFILRLSDGHTLLVAHNIDLAPRIDDLRVKDYVGFMGEYEWNPQGGVLHWTHHDPGGRHPGGWLSHNGKTYQ
ncbi:Protein of unknown function [Halopseudomonas sabulinigri]|uniref:DUF3465 domain-containing protein n=1 Tax=Halopseudomonas sabulinigri TaxID=472181 RepID=A0A1H1LQ37_9GAMM|nr:DUF3465 domain-containing protein [Halopseudomonas sabulinigri]SDR76724.1 Protein of unknown function [Halopseudomonas sabulinigri]